MELDPSPDQHAARSEPGERAKSPSHNDTSAVKDKYSSRKDMRDGYRENGTARSPGSDYNDSKDRPVSDHKSASQNDLHSNHKHSKSVSPSQVSPNVLESPRSHRDHNTRGKDSNSPRSKGKHSATSPVPSPSKTSKPAYPSGELDPLELSKISSIERDGDMNFPESDDDSITGEINPPVDDSRVRLFVALFDYDPETMSPNQDSVEEELPFREGQILKVASTLCLWMSFVTVVIVIQTDSFYFYCRAFN